MPAAGFTSAGPYAGSAGFGACVTATPRRCRTTWQTPRPSDHEPQRAPPHPEKPHPAQAGRQGPVPADSWAPMHPQNVARAPGGRRTAPPTRPQPGRGVSGRCRSPRRRGRQVVPSLGVLPSLRWAGASPLLLITKRIVTYGHALSRNSGSLARRNPGSGGACTVPKSDCQQGDLAL
jgi:hypothetical protein